VQQDLELELKKVTRSAFEKAVAAMGLDMNIAVKETKNAEAIRQTDKELSKAEKLKPVNCNCDCFSDSTGNK
jgi:hypothetical protein